MGFCNKRYPLHCSLFWLHCLSIPVLIAALSFSFDTSKKVWIAHDLTEEILQDDLKHSTEEFKRGQEGVARAVGTIRNICIAVQILLTLSLISFVIIVTSIASLLNDFRAFPFNLIRKRMLQDINVIMDE